MAPSVSGRCILPHELAKRYDFADTDYFILETGKGQDVIVPTLLSIPIVHDHTAGLQGNSRSPIPGGGTGGGGRERKDREYHLKAVVTEQGQFHFCNGPEGENDFMGKSYVKSTDASTTGSGSLKDAIRLWLFSTRLDDREADDERRRDRRADRELERSDSSVSPTFLMSSDVPLTAADAVYAKARARSGQPTFCLTRFNDENGHIHNILATIALDTNDGGGGKTTHGMSRAKPPTPTEIRPKKGARVA
jgi:hypothetical protein